MWKCDQFKGLNAEELSERVPTDEDPEWECKGKRLFEKNNDQLRSEISQAASAMANSGGGMILFGVDDKTKALEPLPEKREREDFDFFLEKMTEQSVSPPLSRLKSFRFESSNNRGNSSMWSKSDAVTHSRTKRRMADTTNVWERRIALQRTSR